MTCRGRGTTHATVKETINVPKGVDNGINLRMAKKGHTGSGGPNGDLIIHVKVRNHSYFKREGAHIHTDLYLNISQAVLGCEVSVNSLYGDVTIKLPPGTQHEARKKITNYGMYKLPPNHHDKGNHFVIIRTFYTFNSWVVFFQLQVSVKHSSHCKILVCDIFVAYIYFYMVS